MAPDSFHPDAPPHLPPSPLQWHALSREEQAKYYELARKERQLHMQLYPGWSARDNYVSGHQHTVGNLQDATLHAGQSHQGREDYCP